MFEALKTIRQTRFSISLSRARSDGLFQVRRHRRLRRCSHHHHQGAPLLPTSSSSFQKEIRVMKRGEKKISLSWSARCTTIERGEGKSITAPPTENDQSFLSLSSSFSADDHDGLAAVGEWLEKLSSYAIGTSTNQATFSTKSRSVHKCYC